jgi:hypothetical protein
MIFKLPTSVKVAFILVWFPNICNLYKFIFKKDPLTPYLRLNIYQGRRFFTYFAIYYLFKSILLNIFNFLMVPSLTVIIGSIYTLFILFILKYVKKTNYWIKLIIILSNLVLVLYCGYIDYHENTFSIYDEHVWTFIVGYTAIIENIITSLFI